MNRDDVIDVLSVVAAATRRTVGQTDVEVWGSVIGHLSKDIALQAVSNHLRTKPGVWLEPGHVATEAQHIALDTKMRVKLQLGPMQREGAIPTAYEGVLHLECENCEAPAGKFCTRDGKPRKIPCTKRLAHLSEAS